jgi:hypothetical protein
MSAPLIIERGRFRLIQGEDCIRMDMDGGTGLVMLLTPAERLSLSKSLWYSVHPKPKETQ